MNFLCFELGPIKGCILEIRMSQRERGACGYYHSASNLLTCELELKVTSSRSKCKFSLEEDSIILHIKLFLDGEPFTKCELQHTIKDKEIDNSTNNREKNQIHRGTGIIGSKL